METIQNKNQSVVIVSGNSSELHRVESEIENHGYTVLPMSKFDNTNLKTRVLLVLSEDSDFDVQACDFVKKIIEDAVPIIAVYPDKKKLADIHDDYGFTSYVTKLWDKIPAFKSERYLTPVVHVPLSRAIRVMNNSDFKVGSTIQPSDYYMIDKSEVE